jgi:hypothetical protein
MAYRLKLQEPIAEGVRRVGLEQLEIAETKLSSSNGVAASVHDARRCLKRVRALLQVVRPGLDETPYRREADRLAAAGRLLSGVRDLDVMQQTVSKLESRFGALPNGAGERLQKRLAHGQHLGRRSGAEGRRKALARLGQARKFFTGKAAAEIEFADLIEGVGRTYHKARKAFRHAYEKPSDESFHAWRKKVQLHWRHMLLLSRGWPEALSARASEAKDLSQLLGEDHDYAILLAFVGDGARSHLDPTEISAIAALCRSCQAELRAAAKPRGERLFAEPTDNLERRLKLYWTSAERLAALAPATEDAPARGEPEVRRVKRVRARTR